MKRLRLFLTVAVIGFMTVAIGAAPAKKRPTTPPSAIPTQTSPTTETDGTLESPDQTAIPFDQVTPIPEEYSTDAGAQSVSPASSGAPINMDWYSINNGGAIEVAAGNIKMGLSIGQNAVGEVSAGNIKMGLGFWYGAGAGSAPTCDCDCHADPQCDSITNILDLAFVINVAFRNDPAIPDPNPSCTYQTTDVDCSTFTDILDITRMVNVAFRFQDPAIEFCNPCAPVL